MFMPHIPKTPAAPARVPGLSGMDDLHAAAGLVGADEVDQRLHNVGGGDDADELIALEHGEAADLPLPHGVRRLLYGVVGERRNHLTGHHVLYQDFLQRRRPLGVPERGGGRAQVPVRDDPDEPPFLEHGQVPDAPLPAQGERRPRRLFRRERYDLAGHRVLYEQHRDQLLPSSHCIAADPRAGKPAKLV